jgi:hypothetical protein
VIIRLPQCPQCSRTLDRVDRVYTEHDILDRIAEKFRPVCVLDGAADGSDGVSAITEVRCPWCHALLPKDITEFYYRHVGVR